MSIQTHRIYVSPCRLRSGEWSKRRVLLASFRSESDAYRFWDLLRAEHPSWIIESYRPGQRRLRTEGEGR